jgi:NADH-quinone oxidoreductase subunit M
MLMLYRKVVFGPRINKDALAMPDLNSRELFLLVPLVLLVLWLGVFPNTVMNKISPSVEKLVTDYHAKLADAGISIDGGTELAHLKTNVPLAAAAKEGL